MKHIFPSIMLSMGMIISVLFPSSTFSQSIYLGAGAGYGQTALPRPAQISYFQRNGADWSGWLGFVFNQNLAVEGGYVRMANVKAAGIINGIDVKDTVEPSMTYVAAKGSLPISTYLKAIGKVGGAYVYGKENLVISGMKTVRSQSKTRLYYAIGTEIPIHEKLSINATYGSTTKKDLIPRLSVFLVGVNVIII